MTMDGFCMHHYDLEIKMESWKPLTDTEKIAQSLILVDVLQKELQFHSQTT